MKKKSAQSAGSKKVSFGQRVKALLGCASKDVVNFTPAVENHQINVLTSPVVNYRMFNGLCIKNALPYDITKEVPKADYIAPSSIDLAHKELPRYPAGFIQPASPGASYNANYSDFTKIQVIKDMTPKYGPRLTPKANKHGVYTEQAIHIRQGANGKFYRFGK